MASGQSLIDLDLLEYVELVAYSNGEAIKTVSASTLLDLDILGLFSSGESFEFPISSDDSPIDRIGVRISSLLGLGVLEGNLQISETTIKPIRPVINHDPEEGSFVICKGQTVTVTPENKAKGELIWYSFVDDSEYLIGTQDSFTTSDELEPGEYEYLVRSTGNSCNGESEPSRFKVKVDPTPAPANYTIIPSGESGIDDTGLLTYIEGINPVILTPNLVNWPGNGEFKWYLDEENAIEIRDGDVIDGVTYSLDQGVLTLSGLKYTDHYDPKKYYLNWIPEDGCSSSSPLELNLSSVARILNLSSKTFNIELTFGNVVAFNWDFQGINPESSHVLQRSGTDLNFKDIWVSTIEQLPEDVKDQSPLFGENYYRLQLFNSHGINEWTSELKRIYISEPSQKAYFVYPNHFSNSLTVGTSYKDTRKIEYVIYSSSGSLLHNGMAEIALQNPLEIEGLDSYVSGEYFLVLTDGKMKFTHHLLKK